MPRNTGEYRGGGGLVEHFVRKAITFRFWGWRVAGPISIIAVVVSACTAVTEPRGFIPAGGEPEAGVLDPRMGVTYTPVAEGWLKCAYRYDGVAVCWLVADTVTVR